MKKRVFDFNKYTKKRFGFFENSRRIEAGLKERTVRERPRDEFKAELCRKIDKNRMEQMLESGELKAEGQRIWRLRLS